MKKTIACLIAVGLVVAGLGACQIVLPGTNKLSTPLCVPGSGPVSYTAYTDYSEIHFYPVYTPGAVYQIPYDSLVSLRYTLDGSEPNENSSLVDAWVRFSVPTGGTVTIKVKAYQQYCTPSETATAVYTN